MPERTRRRAVTGRRRRRRRRVARRGGRSLIDGRSAKAVDCRFAPAARRYTARADEEHRHPHLRARLQHGGDRARLRRRGLGRAHRRRRQQPRRRRRPGVRARSAASPTEVVDHRALREPRRLRRRARRAASSVTAPTSSRSPASCASSAPAFVRRFDGRLVNIHPSLLPAFPGLHTHRRAIEAGCKASGATRPFRHRRPRPRADHRPGGRAGARRRQRGGARGARARAGASCSIRARSRWLVEGALERRDGVVRHRDGESQLLLARTARRPRQKKLAAALIENARIVVLKTNDSTDWNSTRRRIARVVTPTSEVCAVTAIVKEK